MIRIVGWLCWFGLLVVLVVLVVLVGLLHNLQLLQVYQISPVHIMSDEPNQTIETIETNETNVTTDQLRQQAISRVMSDDFEPHKIFKNMPEWHDDDQVVKQVLQHDYRCFKYASSRLHGMLDVVVLACPELGELGMLKFVSNNQTAFQFLKLLCIQHKLDIHHVQHTAFRGVDLPDKFVDDTEYMHELIDLTLGKILDCNIKPVLSYQLRGIHAWQQANANADGCGMYYIYYAVRNLASEQHDQLAQQYQQLAKQHNQLVQHLSMHRSPSKSCQPCTPHKRKAYTSLDS